MIVLLILNQLFYPAFLVLYFFLHHFWNEIMALSALVGAHSIDARRSTFGILWVFSDCKLAFVSIRFFIPYLIALTKGTNIHPKIEYIQDHPSNVLHGSPDWPQFGLDISGWKSQNVFQQLSQLAIEQTGPYKGWGLITLHKAIFVWWKPVRGRNP